MTIEELLTKYGVDNHDGFKAELKNNGIYLSTNENIDERYEKLKTQKETLDSELSEANKTIDSLKENNQSNEALQAKIGDYEAKVNQLQELNAAKDKSYAIDLALTQNNAKNITAVKALLDMDSIEVTDNGVKGLSEQVEKLKESDSYLFQQAEDAKPKRWSQGNSTVETGGLSKDEIMKETDRAKRQQMIQDNPHLFQ